MKKTQERNPIKKYAKSVKHNKQLIIQDKIFLSILVSTGCRPSEAKEYRCKKIDKSEEIVVVTLPIHKKRKAMTRDIPISYKLFGINPRDYKTQERNIRSLRTLQRISEEILGMSPREYRHTIAIYVLKKKNIAYVRDMLCHSDIRTTQHYLVNEKVDFQELIDF